METQKVNLYIILAEAFYYPAPEHLMALQAGLAEMPAGGIKKSLAKFIEKIAGLSLGEWEELHTRTLDLTPPAAPYIGFQTWGESYQRGIFLSKMNRALYEARIDLDGELPDHLGPVLRYLGQVDQPLPELVKIFNPALKRILSVLSSSDPGNPYIDLLEAVQELCSSLNKEAE